MSTRATSLKATTPLEGLRGAQAEYEEANKQFRQRQREILQDTFASVVAALEDNESQTFRDAEDFAEYAGDESADIWFDAVAFVYKAKTRAARQKASKHASALRLLYEEGVPADGIAAKIKERHGIQKLANEAAAGSHNDEEEQEEENEGDEEDQKERKKEKEHKRTERSSGAARGPRHVDDLTLHVEMSEERLQQVLGLAVGEKARLIVECTEIHKGWKRIVGRSVKILD
ncbi:MAG: hypothetical protein K0S06_1771 [Microvirga sp.]|jgi:hypothetical protein|nr:hypothetical protein [Microvirga sp.]